MQFLQVAPTFLAVLLLAFLGFLVVHNQYKRVNLFFLFFVAVDSLWLVSVFAINFTSLNSSALLGRVVFASAVCLIVGALLFIDALLHFYQRRSLKLLVYIASAALLVTTLFTPSIIKGVALSRQDGSVTAFPIYGPLYFLFLVYLLFAVAAILAPLLIGTKTNKNNREVTLQQLTFIRLGIVLFASVSVATNQLLPNILHSSVPSMFAPLGSLALASAFFVAIGRYKLFDIRFVAIRAAAYLTTLFVMTFVFITPFVWVINRLLGQAISGGQFALVVILSVCLLYLLQYIRKRFDTITAKIFFRNDYDPQDVQDRLSDILVRTANLNEVRESTAKVLQQALRSAFTRFVLLSDQDLASAKFAQTLLMASDDNDTNVFRIDELGEKEKGLSRIMRERDVALAIKLHTTHEDLGFMILGHKQSGELYSLRDLRLLVVAADEIAISLQNVLRFEQIQRFNVTLQDEVDTATRKLKRQNKRLEELDDIKDDFISMASHQLRTPLTSVKGYLSMVLEGDAGKLSGDQKMMLKQAFASSQRMVFLITDLLNVSRLKTGKFVIDAAPTNLKTVVQQELGQLQEAAAAKNLELIYKPPKTFPELMLDEVKIRQVIMNFVDNAIYYTPAGGRIKVELTETPSNVEMRVVDNGIGVPKSEQHHLFTKFYRATNARTARPDGTGLGLFMAQKVIVAQGGSVIFSSREGKGSTFGFSFSKSRLAAKKPTQVPLSEAVKPEPARS